MLVNSQTLRRRVPQPLRDRKAIHTRKPARHLRKSRAARDIWNQQLKNRHSNVSCKILHAEQDGPFSRVRIQCLKWHQGAPWGAGIARAATRARQTTRAHSRLNAGHLSKEGSGHHSWLGWKKNSINWSPSYLDRATVYLVSSQSGSATRFSDKALHAWPSPCTLASLTVSCCPVTEGGGSLDITSDIQLHLNNSKDSWPHLSSKEFLWKCRPDLLTLIVVFCYPQPSLSSLPFPIAKYILLLKTYKRTEKTHLSMANATHVLYSSL